MKTKASPITVKCIDHLLLHVKNMREAVGFYTGVLGCEVESDMPQFGMMEIRAGSSHIAFVDTSSEGGAWARPDSGGRNLDHVALALESSQTGEVRVFLSANNIAIVEERDEGDTYSLYVKDPSGNTIELITSG